MKNRIIAVILSLMMIVASASILVNAADVMLGDIDGNEKVTAMDARMTLRAAARIDTLTEEQFVAADVNFDGKVTAMDARTILRAAARIEDLPEMPTEDTSETETTTAETTTAETTTAETTTEEPDTGVVVTDYPEDIKAFFSGAFYLDGEMGTEGDMVTVKMATNKSGTEIVMDSGKGIFSIYATRSSSFLKVVTPEGKKYYVEITKEMMQNFGIDFTETLADFSFLTNANAGDPVLTHEEIDGKVYDVYLFTNEDGSGMKFIVDGEDVTQIAICDKDGRTTSAVIVNELSASIPKTMLTTKGYTKTSILYLSTLLGDAFG